MFAETTEYLPDMFAVFGRVIGVDKNIVQINNHGHVHHVGEDIVHKPLESGRSIGKTKRHHQPFERPVPGTERGLVFVTRCNAYQVVRMPEVDLRVDPGSPGSIQKISN